MRSPKPSYPITLTAEEVTSLQHLICARLMARFGANCSLALYKKNTIRRNILLGVADKQPANP